MPKISENPSHIKIRDPRILYWVNDKVPNDVEEGEMIAVWDWEEGYIQTAIWSGFQWEILAWDDGGYGDDIVKSATCFAWLIGRSDRFLPTAPVSAPPIPPLSEHESG